MKNIQFHFLKPSFTGFCQTPVLAKSKRLGISNKLSVKGSEVRQGPSSPTASLALARLARRACRLARSTRYRTRHARSAAQNAVRARNAPRRITRLRGAAPPSPLGTAMAYDPGRQRVVSGTRPPPPRNGAHPTKIKILSRFIINISP